MQKTFQFVHGVGIDSQSRKLIRSHVMQGKNAGKLLHRPSRKKATRLRVVRQSGYRSLCPGDSGLAPRAPLGDAFDWFPYPVTVTSYARRTIDAFFSLTVERMYPLRLGLSMRDVKAVYLRLLFVDESSYYCNLAIMQASNELFLGSGRNSAAALHRLAETLAHVRKKLDGHEALSDSTMAIVIALIHQEQFQKQHLAAKAHVDGLNMIVQLRGGLEELEHNVPLVLKICKLDFIFALQHGGPTTFYRDRLSEVRLELAAKGIPLESVSVPPSLRRGLLHPRLLDVLSDMMSICFLFNTKTRTALGVFTFQEMVFSCLSRLLAFRSLNESRRECDAAAAHHVGLVVLVMSVFLPVNHRRIVDYAPVSLCLEEVLEAGPEELEDDFILWLMFVGGIWLSSNGDTDWLIRKLGMSVRRLGIETWDEARRRVSKYPWLDALHDQQGHKLWTQMHSGGSLQRRIS